jgi:hypothetical protein
VGTGTGVAGGVGAGGLATGVVAGDGGVTGAGVRRVGVGGAGTGGLRGFVDGGVGFGRLRGCGLARLAAAAAVCVGWTTTTTRARSFFALTLCGRAVTRARVCRLECCGAIGAGGAITTGGAAVCERGRWVSPDTGAAGWRKLPNVNVRATNPTVQAAAKARSTSREYPFAARQLQLLRAGKVDSPHLPSSGTASHPHRRANATSSGSGPPGRLIPEPTSRVSPTTAGQALIPARIRACQSCVPSWTENA